MDGKELVLSRGCYPQLHAEESIILFSVYTSPQRSLYQGNSSSS